MKISVQPINSKDIWESFVLSRSPEALFQSWLWGEVQKQLGSRVSRAGFYDGGRLVGLAQAVTVEAKRGRFLHVRHGPILATHTLGLWRTVLDYLKTLAKDEHAWFIRISPLIAGTQANRELFASLGLRHAAIHAMDAELCWVLDLSPTEAELLSGMRKTTRYEIKRAQKMGVGVTQSTNLKDFAAFLTLYKKTSQRQEFVPHRGIREEFEMFRANNLAVLYIAKHEGQLLAGAIILFYGNQAIYHHSASVPSRVPASYAIQWEAIREAKKRGMKVYNYWGIAPENKPNHPWRGITLFKTGFGGRRIEYIHAHDLPVSPWYILPRAVETTRRILKGY